MDLWTRTWIFYNFLKWSTAAVLQESQRQELACLYSSRSNGLLHPFLFCHIYLTLLLFLSLFCSGNKSQTSWPRPAWPHHFIKSYTQILRRKNWIDSSWGLFGYRYRQSSRPKAQCPVSREGLAYMTTLCERDIEWGSNDQPPGLRPYLS